jgi:hypothetical protein
LSLKKLAEKETKNVPDNPATKNPYKTRIRKFMCCNECVYNNGSAPEICDICWDGTQNPKYK